MNFVDFSKSSDYLISWVILIANILISSFLFILIIKKKQVVGFISAMLFAAFCMAVGQASQILFMHHELIRFSSSMWKTIFLIKIASQFLGAVFAIFGAYLLCLKCLKVKGAITNFNTHETS